MNTEYGISSSPADALFFRRYYIFKRKNCHCVQCSLFHHKSGAKRIIVGESCLGDRYNGLSSPSFGGRFIVISSLNFALIGLALPAIIFTPYG